MSKKAGGKYISRKHKVHSAFFPMTQELLHLVLLTNCIEEKAKVHYSLPNIDR
jgi:hypothetical protein